MSGAPVEVFTSLVQVVRGLISSVSVNPRHGIGKRPCASIRLVAGLGVEGDAHFGELVQQRWLKKKDPTLLNRTQVHLLHQELLADLAGAGKPVSAGELGENVTTVGIDLLSLPVGTRLRLGATAVVELTGLREPCSQLNRVRPGLMGLLRYRDGGKMVRKAGVMSVVLLSGEVRPGDLIELALPDPPWMAMGPV